MVGPADLDNSAFGDDGNNTLNGSGGRDSADNLPEGGGVDVILCMGRSP